LSLGKYHNPEKRFMQGSSVDTRRSTLPEEVLWVAIKQVLQALNFLHTSSLSESIGLEI
jgi:hypothetical protein